MIRVRVRVWNELRDATGLDTNTALAERLGVSERSVSRVLNGATPSAEFIANALVAFPFAGFDRLFTVAKATS